MTERRKFADAVPSLVLLVVAVFYCVASFQYSPSARAMPLGVATLALVLVLVDLISLGEGRISRIIRRIFQGSGAPAPVPGLDGQAGQRFPPARELAAFGWIIAFLLLAIALGFYIAIPIYVTAYLRFYGGKSVLVAAATGLGLVAALYGMFELLLGYEVFEGLVFGDIM